jgi:RNA polymerase sigma-70 factor (ECF subfamily)
MGDLLAEANWIRALARSLVADASTADDVVQETWLAILKRPPRVGQPLRPWLAKVVRNFARMRRRGESNRRRREEASARREAVPATTQMVEKVEVQRVLADAVLQLEEPFRSTVLLRYFEGLSAAEIARRTDTPAGTVRWRLKRGLDDLRRSLDDERGGRAGWFGVVLAIAEGPGAPAGLGTLISAPIPVALALFFGLVTIVAAVFGPRVFDRAERGGVLAVAPVAETDVDRSESKASPLTGAPDDARRPAESPLRELRSSSEGVKGLGRSIQARVVDPSGQPLEGALLEGAGGSVRSSEAGELTLALGSWGGAPVDVVIRAEGYVPHRDQVRVPDGRPTHLGSIVLEAAGAVRGRVLDENGRPVAGAPVSIEALGSRWLGFRHLPLEEARYLGSLLDRVEDPAPHTLTGPNGEYRVPGLAAGYVRVWAGAEGVFYDYSQPVAVRSGLESEAPELTLRAPTENELIAGQVLDPSGAPVPFALVEAARRSLQAAFFRGESVVFHATADEFGRFELALDPTARYDVAARDPGGRWRPTVDTPHATGERDVFVRLGEWRRFELEMDGPGAADLQLELVDARRGRRLVPETASAVLPRVRAPAVPFLVRVHAHGFASVELGPYEPDLVPPVLHGDMLPLGGPRGQVVLAGGAAVAGADLLLLRALGPDAARVYANRSLAQRPFFALIAEGKAVCRTSTDDAGQFVLPEAVGSYFLRVEAEGRAPTWLGPLELDGTPGEPLSITLDHGGSIAGRVVVPEGEDPAGTVVGLSCGDGRVRSQRVTPEGAYRFDDLSPGPWQVRRLSRETAASGWNRLSTRAHEVTRASVDWDCEVTAGSVTNYDLVLASEASCTVAGRFRIDGRAPGPWHAHLVRVDDESGARRTSAAIDHEGRFELSVIGEGRYVLELWNSGYRPLYVVVRDELQLRPGPLAWEYDLISATLSGEGAGAEEDLAHVFEASGYLTVTTLIATDTEGRFEVDCVPAGASRLEHAGKPSLELSLPAGTGTHLELNE